jgi:hypothetical protein
MHALLFELNAIQSYLFASGRLRDVIGASELIDRLTNREAHDNLLDAVCHAAGLCVCGRVQGLFTQIAGVSRSGTDGLGGSFATGGGAYSEGCPADGENQPQGIQSA